MSENSTQTGEKPKRFIDDVRGQIDKVNIVLGADGKEHEVAVIYGNEPWQDVFARVIRGHYLD